MDVIDSIKRDKEYIKCKLLVKTWERDFKLKFSRTPSKFDIKEAPAKIKYAYKKYFQLKSAALENSLCISDGDDEIHVSQDPATYPSFNSINFDALSPHSEPMVPELPTGQEIEKLLSNSPIQLISKPLSPFTDNLSKKLFQSRKFSMRNPRKLSLYKTQSMTENNDSVENQRVIVVTPEKQTVGELPVFEGTTINNILNSPMSTNTMKNSINNTAQKTSMINNMNSSVSSLFGNKTSVRHLNEAWIERATGLTLSSDTNKRSNEYSKFGLANIKIHPAEVSQGITEDKTCDYVENSESDGEDTTISRLKPALKKRKIDYNSTISNPQRHSEVNDEKVLTKPSSKQRKVKKKKIDVLDNPQTKKITRASKIDTISDMQHPPDIHEYLPFGMEENITPRHSDVSNILKNFEIATKTSENVLECEGVGKLEKKIKSGTLNENFLKINIEKKVFVRGKKHLNFTKYKKQQWKNKKALHSGMEFPESGKISCFKCGMTGHMAKFCTSQKGDKLLPLESYDDSDIPTLNDMQVIVSKETNGKSITEELSASIFEPSQIPEYFMKLLGSNTISEKSTELKPIYSNIQEKTPQDVIEALDKFGHKTFRPGQEQAIMRILSGMSTLLILSTGGGKSLCYQLPAYIYSQHYKCITLVISPLVSLMEDQVISMPDFLKAGCLHSNQPPTQRKKIIQYLKDGEINILLISPEALISGDSSNGFVGIFKSLPQIAFACIDEAHCVSQWSHNFRPSYLMICRVLREKLNVKCILGLTATASQKTVKSIINHIDIPDGITGVITNPTLPDNLYLSVSIEENKDKALLSYLTSERLESFSSIIVYCIRRDECERVAAILRSCLQEPGKINMEKQKNKRKRMSYIAEPYHAGMSASQRKKIQSHFMDGTLRIIVATVAFGMGINKSDIRCIVHYNMPSSFESYVQEVGRAGRDGKDAYCHVFMNSSNTDKNELLKHIHANTIDRATIRKLIQKVFVPCECAVRQNVNQSISISALSRCKGHEVGIPVDRTVEELDLQSENISTLLCYVELHHEQYIKVLSNAYTKCKISSYGGPQKIAEAAKNCPPLAMAYLVESKKDPLVMKQSTLEFDVIEVAAAIGWQSGMSKYHLKNLEWITDNGTSKRSFLKVEFHTLGFRINAPGDLDANELDKILDDLHETVIVQEKTMLYQLEESHNAFSKLGNYSLETHNLTENILIEKSNELKGTIRNYFEREDNFPAHITLDKRSVDTERVLSDVRALICSYKDCTFTGRSIAKIFQGISSPNYPAIVWGRCKFWRSHIHEDFHTLIKLATQEVIQMRKN